MKFRKRTATNLPDLQPLSTQLREVRNEIQFCEYPTALAVLNGMLTNGNPDNVTRARILSFAADSQLQQGKYADAVNFYQSAQALLSSHPRAWLRPALGEVISLLRGAQASAALARARVVVQTAISIQSQMPPMTVPPHDRVAVAARPWGADTVAARLGKHFLAEGELAAAKEMLNRAQLLNPNPTFFTSLALADIAEREDRLPDAANLVKQALTAGTYRAKTLSAWPLLLRINQRLGTPGVSSQLLLGLQPLSPGVRARALLLITKTLRSQSVAQWMQLATDWLASSQAVDYPRVTGEFNKLILSSQRLQASAPAAQITAATQLEATPLVSPTEFLFAIKEQVRASCFLTSAPPADWQPLVTQMVTRYGATFRAQATHSLALSYMLGRRHDLARAALQANVATTSLSDPQWAKSVTALARMEKFLGNHAAAAQWSWQLSKNAAVPARFQLRSLLSWVSETLVSATPTQAAAALAQARPQLQNAIVQLQDYNVLLDLGRELTFAPPALKDLADSAVDRGVPMALAAFALASDAPSAAVILAKTAQRQSDLRRYADVTAFWESLSTAKKTWLWSSKEEFWTYLTLVFQAYDNRGNIRAAESLARTYLGDPALPPAAAPVLAIPYGLFQLRTNRTANALQTFAWAVSKNPSASSTAAGYYWLALSAWKSGDHNGAAALAGSVLLALGGHAGKLMDHQLQGKALLLQAGLNPTAVSVQTTNFDVGHLQRLVTVIQVDLARLH